MADENHQDALRQLVINKAQSLLSSLRASPDEIAALQRKEHADANDPSGFRLALRGFENQNKRRRMAKSVASLARGTPRTFRATETQQRLAAASQPKDTGALLAGLLRDRLVACDCVTPFKFAGLYAQGDLSGPTVREVTLGILGANATFDGQYALVNAGDTSGTTRVPKSGFMFAEFQGTVASSGRHCLIRPAGTLIIRGHSKVIGSGDSSTSYDAKIHVEYLELICLDDGVVHFDILTDVHQDATRSETRRKNFATNVQLDRDYLFIDASQGQTVSLQLMLNVWTEANEDGFASVTIETFGFPANEVGDYDSFLVLSGR